MTNTFVKNRKRKTLNYISFSIARSLKKRSNVSTFKMTNEPNKKSFIKINTAVGLVKNSRLINKRSKNAPFVSKHNATVIVKVINSNAESKNEVSRDEIAFYNKAMKLLNDKNLLSF
jgi:hypothetical protein